MVQQNYGLGLMAYEQTQVRVPESLLSIMKERAMEDNRSVNSWVTVFLLSAVQPSFPHLPDNYKLHPEVERLCGFMSDVSFSKEELDGDPRLAKILGE